jgi:hypothetical protein
MLRLKNALIALIRMQKLGGFFRNKFEGKKVHHAAVKSILSTMQSMAGNSARPHRKSLLAFYSGKYYATKLKDGFDEVWDKAKSTLPGSARISMCQDYVKSSLEAETEEFKTELAQEADEEYQRALAVYRKGRSVPEQAAETYHK